MIGASLAGSGCNRVCTGAECESLFDASMLTLHQGTNRITQRAEQNPTTGELLATVVGASEDGRDWQALIASQTVIVSTPALSEILSVRPAQRESDKLEVLIAGRLVGETESDRFGAAMVRAPDVTGGGVDELWVGAPGTSGGSNTLEAGAAYLFADLADGWTEDDLTTDDALLVIRADRAYDQLGQTLAGCEDMDGDRRGDLLVTTAWGDATGGGETLPLAGQVHAILSSALLGEPEERLTSELEWTWAGLKTGAQLGRALDCGNDLTGDGLANAVLGSPFAVEVISESGENTSDGAGAVYVLKPPEEWTGDLLTDSLRILNIEADEDAPDSVRELHFGMAVLTGDLDGDNRAELIVGATGANNGAGAVYIYEGQDLVEGRPRDPITINGTLNGGHFGARLAVADLDGDGINDLVVGAPRANLFGRAATFASGVVYLFTKTELFDGPETFFATEAPSTFAFEQQFLELGEGIAVGDYDGDSVDDVLFTLQVDPEDLPGGE